MNFEESVEKLFKKGENIKMSPHEIDLIHAATGISGEAGEILDLIKKSVFNKRDLNLPSLVEEMGDVEFYMAALRQTLGISRADVLYANATKLGIRYPSGYNDEDARKRRDK